MSYTVAIVDYSSQQVARRTFATLPDALDMVASVYGGRVDLCSLVQDVRAGVGYVAMLANTCLTVTATQH